MNEVMTVTGPVDADELGITLSHEHLLIDLSLYAERPSAASGAVFFDTPVAMEHLDRLRRNPYANRDDCILGDVDVAVDEARQFQRLGGRTIVDLTNPDIGRDPGGLVEVARATGLNVVAGCGHYVHSAHPADLDGRSVDELADEMTTDLTVGIDGTDVRAGIIGEIGTTFPLHPVEERVLRAAALAHRRTGATISLHTHPPYDYAHHVLDLLESEDVDPAHVVVGHADGTLGRADLSLEQAVNHHASLAARGAYVEYDLCGNNGRFEHAGLSWWLPSDQQRANAVAALVKRGHGDRLLLSHDVGHKHYLTRWGGWGYGHVLRSMPTILAESGVDNAALQRILIDNPARMLSGGTNGSEAAAGHPRAAATA